MAATANLRIDQGATFTTDVTVIGSTGDVFDLTGYSASAKLAQGYASTRTRISFTTTIATDATTGVVTLKLTADQTNTLEAPARYVYDVEIVKTSDSTVTRVIEGIITVSPSITL
jgi:hypothetical protein|tara:strand:+ start:10102 stop:10446 length:345 start_codon:yes stop_codon:yes gene_type:complete